MCLIDPAVLENFMKYTKVEERDKMCQTCCQTTQVHVLGLYWGLALWFAGLANMSGNLDAENRHPVTYKETVLRI